MTRSLPAVLISVLVAGAAAGAAPYQRPGSAERISISTSGEEAEVAVAFSPPRMSADGRLVVFTSPAANLVTGDEEGFTDVFLRDRDAGTTERLSVAPGGIEADGASTSGSLSADGRMAAFSSGATNLVPGDTNGKVDVFVLDRETGDIRNVTLGGNNASSNPLISGDGRRVAFLSQATNLVAGDTNALADTFVHDIETSTTTLVSAALAGAPANGASASAPAISGDGRHVAFNSAATNLVAGDANSRTDTFARDLQTGVTELVSVSSEERQTREAVFSAPSISADGRSVAFDTWAWQLVPLDTNGDIGPVFINFAVGFDVYVRDRLAGTTTEATVTSAGVESNLDSAYPQLSPDGRYVTFTSPSTNLVPGDTALQTDVFVHDLLTATTERVSVSGTGEQGDDGSFLSTISDGGRSVAFQSGASNLSEGDSNGVADIYVRDRGADLDVLGATAERTEDGVRISGHGAFSGAVVGSRTDPAGDAIAAVPGADLTGADVIYRPELDDLVVRLHLTDLPEIRDPRTQVGTAGTMGVVYGFELDVGGTRFVARGSQRGAAVSPRIRDPEAGTTHTPSSEETWRFELLRCGLSCQVAEPVTVIAGGYGTTGDEVRFAIPLASLGVSPGAQLPYLVAFTAPGDVSATLTQRLDYVVLDAAAVPRPVIRLSVAEGDIEVPTSAGGFTATIPADAGSVEARACLGSCGKPIAVSVSG